MKKNLIVLAVFFGLAGFVYADLAEEHYRSGLTLSRQEKWGRALTEFQQAYQLSPEDEKVCLSLGLAYRHLGDIEQAVFYLEKSLAIDPQSVTPNFVLAFIYEKKKDTKNAIRYWEQFLKLSNDEGMKDIAKKHLQHLKGTIR